MDSVDVKSLIAILTFLAGAGSAALAMLKSYGQAERKRFAAEREFMHLKNNQEQMKQSLATLSEEVDEIQADLKTQVALFQVMMTNSGQTISGIFAHREKGDSQQH